MTQETYDNWMKWWNENPTICRPLLADTVGHMMTLRDTEGVVPQTEMFERECIIFIVNTAHNRYGMKGIHKDVCEGLLTEITTILSMNEEQMETWLDG